MSAENAFPVIGDVGLVSSRFIELQNGFPWRHKNTYSRGRY